MMTYYLPLAATVSSLICYHYAYNEIICGWEANKETKNAINLISYNHTKGLFFKNKERNANDYYFLSLELWHSIYVNKHGFQHLSWIDQEYHGH